MSIDRDPIPSREQLAFEAYEVTGIDPTGSVVHVLGFEDGAQVEMIIPTARIDSTSPGVVDELVPGDYILYTLVREGEPQGLIPPRMIEEYTRVLPVNFETEFS